MSANIREIVAFPMNQQAMDLMMQAPASVPPGASARAAYPSRSAAGQEVAVPPAEV